MKNCYIPEDYLKVVLNFKPGKGYEFFSCDPAVRQSYELLNPVLSNGHRLNPISAILDKSLPRELQAQLSQFIQRIPIDRSVSDLSDEELSALLPPRFLQQQPDLDVLRHHLSDLIKDFGIVPDPAPSSVSDPSSTPAPGSTSEPSSTPAPGSTSEPSSTPAPGSTSNG
ncbi:MAG: hypothetical protein ACTTJ9_04295 [Segatella oris]|uniref:hypothetical protein n=1 Tax=Segatella oris TaxID=28135 RepID=UPI003FA31BC9